ncbi:MarR family winged helix-turn-helix transcriptional regulator [Streptomyces sp. NPDC060184]|uniref:MarR family winged helix-turn-helix transcriptional regulator n=1 Tax=Streptomyces sp. NPDC060184 TaxID=3347064 RepID=UPI00364865CD
MDRAVKDVEYEQMLLSRHGLLNHRRGRRENGVLERSAYILLSRIRIQGPMSIGELSEAFDLDTSTLNRQTTAAMRAGLVQRIPDPAGGMARKFRITAEGGRILDEEREGMIESLGRVMVDWPREDVASFARYLRRFNTDLERLGGRPWPRP